MEHSLAVARRMHEIVEQRPSEFSCNPEDAFVLGLLHDIGYAFAPESEYHADVGGIILKYHGYPLWQEVYHHHSVDGIYSSQLLELLNYVDMTTNEKGQVVSTEERIEEIGNIFGKGSFPEINAVAMALTLKDFSETTEPKKKGAFTKLLGKL